jgi:hypothetical protein
MTIIHVVEAFGGGIIEFIKNLTDDAGSSIFNKRGIY